MRELPTGTVTFLFTDVEGSTKLLHELGADAYAEALGEHRRVIREACAADGGVEVDTQGDAFFFAFPTAPGAVAAASAFTEALTARPIQVRVGLHTGTPLLTDEGYIGDDVHFGARVASSSHGGQVVLSKETAELVELELIDLGEHRLKDIPQPVSIYQLGDDSFPPLKTISNTNLPRPASSFVGRDDELLEVLSRFEDGARLVTLTGPGGTGKTRLAIEAAASLVPEYKAGVFWVGLASLRDAALVTETIAQTLGAKDGLVVHIGEREVLLLLDNLEQVIDAASELSSLLTACPNLTMLVTSRELLRVQGEVEYRVPPLAEPEAASLFCERAQLEPSAEITELCVGLDNLPLAVELAAARAKALSPVQILERLSQRLDLLKGGRDADPRQHTLRATIEWSYELLTPDEQQLFARLSVFAGGCTLEAAEEVCDADLDTLQSLVEKSLLRFTNERYWMLETIREFAGQRLEASGEGQELWRQHAEFFAALAARAEPALFGSRGQAAWLKRLDLERLNITEAIGWARRADAELALGIVGSVWRYWWYRGYLVEGSQHATDVLAVEHAADSQLRLKVLEAASYLAYRRGDIGAMGTWCDEALELARASSDEPSEGIFVNQLALVAAVEGDQVCAEALLEESTRLLAGHPYARYPLGNVGLAALRTGDVTRARAIFDTVLELDRAAGDDHHFAGIAAWQAVAATLDGRELEAKSYACESLNVARELGADEVVATGLVVAARLAASHSPDRAALMLGSADEILERIGARRRELVPGMYEQLTVELGDVLGSEEFARAYEHGRRLSLDDAVVVALESLD